VAVRPKDKSEAVTWPGGALLTLATVFVFTFAGCSNSPGSFGSRLTENGRLLADGPPARMTASAVAESQADAVPLLYAFALQTGQIRQKAGETFPATDPGLQQAALLDGGIDWPTTTLVGEGYIDTQCDRFLGALNELERTRRGTFASLNAVQSATIGIMGLALAAQKAIGIVGIAFGLTASLFDDSTSIVLYQLPSSAIRTIVKAQRDVLRQDEQLPNGVLARVTNQGLASARLGEYIQYCVPVTIETNVASVIGSTAVGPNATIITGPTRPAITSSLAPVISGIKFGTPVTPVMPPDPKVGRIVDRPVNNRLVAFSRFIRTVTDSDVLKETAGSLGIDPTSTDPAFLQASIIATVSNRVRGDDPALANSRMDQIVRALQPIIHQTF
jgi:hypothetical protein